ncbi:MAG: zf-HC2 domain-containing protein [Longimicrobiales bacterium]
MIERVLHPGFVRLSRYADQELAPRARRRVADHLAGCPRCRERLRFIREIDLAARAIPVEPPRDRVLDRILARRAAGERVILPTSDPRPARRPARSLLGVAAALTLATVSAILLFSARELGADHSELEFSPQRPTAGASVRVEYRSGSLFAEHDYLRLRARFRAADGSVSWSEPAVLAREDAGLYRGAFVLPVDARYGAFAVETLDADQVDSNDRRLWDLMVQDAAGRPLPEAYEQRIEDVRPRNWGLALETAQEYARSYPNRPESAYALFILERQVTDGDDLQTLRATHGERFSRFHHQLADARPLSPLRLQTMAFYASAVGAADAAEFWRARLVNEAPRHVVAAGYRGARIARETEASPLKHLALLEALWNETRAPEVAVAGLMVAGRTGNSMVASWADRVDGDTWDLMAFADFVLATPGGNDVARRMLNRARRQLANSDRPLESSRSEFDASLRQQEQAILAAVGARFLTAGNRVAAVAAFDSALEGAWVPMVYKTVADARLEMGDSLAALRLYAAHSVDPSAPVDFESEIRRLLSAQFDDSVWQNERELARSALARHALRRATTIALPQEVQLIDTQGRSHPARDVIAGRHLVAFWSSRFAPAREDVPTLARYVDGLMRRGTRTTVVIPERPNSEMLDYLGQYGVTAPVYFDPAGEASLVFRQSGIPGYALVDGQGRIRFIGLSIDQVMQSAEALKIIEERTAVVADQ